MNSEIQDINTWNNKLGLFPLNLFTKDSNQFILLNGSNSFCIDLENNLSNNDYLNYSWSTDTNAFVSIDNQNLNIFRWFSKGMGHESIAIKRVESNFDKFYEYLIQAKSDKDNSIIPFIIRLLGRIRNLLGEKFDARISLNNFLSLLATSSSDDDIEINKWGLNENYCFILKEKYKDYFYKLLSELNNGLLFYNLKPNIDLVLRHTSGKLFQEAHYEAVLNRQIDLFGLPSSSERLMKNTQRKNSGVFYTPSYITRLIVENCFKNYKLKDSIIIFDPACGSGEFLKEAIRQLKIKNYKGKIKVIGWDCSPIAIDLAKFALHFEKLQWIDNNIEIELREVNDSLIENWNFNVDVILMNPPYVSWELMDASQRDSVKNSIGDKYQRNPNLASAFIWKAFQTMSVNSILGCIIPTSLLNADSYRTIRNELSESLQPCLIGKLGNYIFSDALVDTSVLVALKSNCYDIERKTTLIWANNIASAASDAIRGLRKHYQNPLSIINEEHYSVYSVDNLKISVENWVPSSYKSLSLIDEIKRNKTLSIVSEIFDVKQGVRTGKNDIFLIDKKFYENLKIKEREYFRPAITNNAIKFGILKNEKYLFYPDSDYLKPIKNEDDLNKYVPTFYENILIKNKDLLSNRARKNTENWWKLSEHRAWQRIIAPKLVSTEFGKAGSFAYDKVGEYVVERGNAWLPKKNYQDFFNDEIYYSYLAIFCSNFFTELLALYSKQIAGGNWYYLGGKHVGNIPIPNLIDHDILNINKELTNIGFDISNGLNIKAELLDNLVKQLYRI